MTIQEFYQAVKTMYGRPFSKKMNQSFYDHGYKPAEAVEELRQRDRSHKARLENDINITRHEILPELKKVIRQLESRIAAWELELAELGGSDD